MVQRGGACRGGSGADWAGDRDDIFHGFWGLAQAHFVGRVFVISLVA